MAFFKRRPSEDMGDPLAPPPEPVVLPAPSDPDFYDPDWNSWKEPRRWPFFALVIALLLGTIGFVSYKALQSSPTTTSPIVITPGVTPTTFLPPLGEGQPANLTFTGDKSTTSKPFTLEGGLSIFTFQCTCESYFGLTVLDAAGNVQAVPFDSLDGGAGSSPQSLAPGTYQLKIAADGKYSVSISQPGAARSLPSLSLPSNHGSEGGGVIGPFPAGTPVLITYGILAYADPPAGLFLVSLNGDMKQIGQVATGFNRTFLPAQSSQYFLFANALTDWALDVVPAPSAPPSTTASTTTTAPRKSKTTTTTAPSTK